MRRSPRFDLLETVSSPLTALAAGAMLIATLAGAAAAKTPGSTYCYYGTCHRVKTIAETESLIGAAHTLHASFYDSCGSDRYNPCGLTSSGERFHPDRPDNAASPIYPDGTRLLVWSPTSKEALVIRVNNAGPYWGNRKLDLSRKAADILGVSSVGVAPVEVRVVAAPTRSEATYSRNRRYDPVLGYIGRYQSLDAAEAGMAAMMAFEMIATSATGPLSGGALVAARNDDGLPQPVLVAAAPVLEPPPAVQEASPSVLVAASEPRTRPRLTGHRTAVAKAEPVDAGPLTPAVQLAEAALRELDAAANEVGKVLSAPEGAQKPAAKSNRRLAKDTNTRSRARTASAKSKGPTKTRVAQAKAPAKTAKAAAVADAPNDISVFSRHAANALPPLKKTAAAKSGGGKRYSSASTGSKKVRTAGLSVWGGFGS